MEEARTSNLILSDGSDLNLETVSTPITEIQKKIILLSDFNNVVKGDDIHTDIPIEEYEVLCSSAEYLSSYSEDDINAVFEVLESSVEKPEPFDLLPLSQRAIIQQKNSMIASYEVQEQELSNERTALIGHIAYSSKHAFNDLQQRAQSYWDEKYGQTTGNLPKELKGPTAIEAAVPAMAHLW